MKHSAWWLGVAAGMMAWAADPVDPNRACAACHPKPAREHARTKMAQTLESAEVAKSLLVSPKLTFRLGQYQYEIAREGKRSIYSVTDGVETIREPLLWALGQGEAAQTYVFEHQGRLFESRVSYYTDTKALDVTIGAPAGAPKNITEAMGRQMTPYDVKACFDCHSSPKPELRPETAPFGSAAWTQVRFPGVRCEHCHTNPWRHSTARQAGDLKTAKLPKLKDLTTEEMSDLCGKCHRTWADIQVNGPKGVANVRFQPYRIPFSKCYDSADPRISCIACHDAHSRDERPPVEAYDKACQACHQPGEKKLCKAGNTAKCASCHMPKYELPGSHFRFADHFIRVVRPGETYPH